MPKKTSLNKILIIGSGPIVIGQAAEFDYAGTQACKAIREEGIETILVNSNPATIMTDKGIADKVYMEPLTEEALEQILDKERPDGMLAGFGGQTGLNLAMELDHKGILKKYGTELLGVNRESIEKGGRPGRIQEADAGDRRADPEQHHRNVYGRMLRLRQGRRLSCDHSSGIYTGRHRRRYRRKHGTAGDALL